MEKYIGYGYTNSSGIATLDYDSTGSSISPSGYTGVGAGEVDFKCKLHEDSTIQSTPYEVVDTILYDDCTSDTTANYYWNSNYVDLEFDTDHFIFTFDGNGDAILMGTTSSGITTNLDRFKGKSLHFEAEVETTKDIRVDIYEYGASSFTQQCKGIPRSTNGKIVVETDNPISNTCTRIYLRVTHAGWTSGSCNVKNMRLWEC